MSTDQQTALTIIDKAKKELRHGTRPEVFPLAATHRKELRSLKSRNLGELESRLTNIKKIKLDEYIKKNKDKINKELVLYQKKANDINNSFAEIKDKIIGLIEKQRKLESSEGTTTFLSVNINYGIYELAHLETRDFKKSTRIWKITDNILIDIAKSEFKKKYGKQFEVAKEKIEELELLYEESINFGDLELVKKIYYAMKDADIFLKKVSELKI